MSLLDRYVGRIALGAFTSAMVFFVFLTVVMHLLNNVARLVARAAEQKLGGFDLTLQLAGFYLRMVPVLVTTVTPFAVVTAAMLTVARLQHANEVVPMLFVGRSIRRILRPVVLLGALAAGGMAACWEWVVPAVGGDLASTEAFLSGGNDEQKFLVHERFGAEQELLYVRRYAPATREIVGLDLLVQGDLAADCTLLHAASATWDPERCDWRLVDGRLTRPVGGGGVARRIEHEPREWLGRPDSRPSCCCSKAARASNPNCSATAICWAWWRHDRTARTCGSPCTGTSRIRCRACCCCC